MADKDKKYKVPDFRTSTSPKADNIFHNPNGLRQLLDDLEQYEKTFSDFYKTEGSEAYQSTVPAQVILDTYTPTEEIIKVKVHKKADLGQPTLPGLHAPEPQMSAPAPAPEPEAPKAMPAYGWIGPDGKYFPVADFASHHTAEPALAQNYRIDPNRMYEFTRNDCVHVSPEDMRLPENLNENHVGTLMDYWNGVEQGHIAKPKGGILEPRHVTHIKKSVDEAMKKLYENDKHNAFVTLFDKYMLIKEGKYTGNKIVQYAGETDSKHGLTKSKLPSLDKLKTFTETPPQTFEADVKNILDDPKALDIIMKDMDAYYTYLKLNTPRDDDDKITYKDFPMNDPDFSKEAKKIKEVKPEIGRIGAEEAIALRNRPGGAMVNKSVKKEERKIKDDLKKQNFERF